MALAPIEFPEPSDITLGSLECLEVTLGNISHRINHRNELTTSSSLESDLKAPIIA